jgi:hypothetical protein
VKSALEKLRSSGAGTARPLATIKAGDRVWVGNYRSPRFSGIKAVSRLTPTQVIIDWHGNGKYEKRYKRGDAKSTALYCVGGSTMGDFVSGIATESEYAAWDAAVAEDEARKAKEAAAKQAREDWRQSLAESFGDDEFVSVGHEYWNGSQSPADKFHVDIHMLSADQVRSLARFVAQLRKS